MKGRPLAPKPADPGRVEEGRTLPRTQILGTGSYVPAKVITNGDLEKLVETSDQWIRERTGIQERRQAAEGERSSDLAVQAARRALEMAGLGPEELDLLIVGTISPDVPMPSCASFVQAKLGAKRAFAFDVSAACAGSLYAMSIADQYLKAGAARRALVVGVEILTRLVDWRDRNTCVLFGDAAGAMVLGPSAEADRGILTTQLFSDGTLTDILRIREGETKVSMNGREVFKVAVRSLTEASQRALSAVGLSPEQVDHVIAHQANLRIIEAVMGRLGLPLAKCWLNIARYGNTSSASLPMTLDEANRAGRLQPGDLILMMAIGAGMTWGGSVVRW